MLLRGWSEPMQPLVIQYGAELIWHTGSQLLGYPPSWIGWSDDNSDEEVLNRLFTYFEKLKR